MNLHSNFERGQVVRLQSQPEKCDGGYVDNEGIVTAVNWIDFFRKRWSSEGMDNADKKNL